MSTILAPALGMGRHRAGRPGLVPVSAFTVVRRRNWFRALFTVPRHRAEQTYPGARPAHRFAAAV